MYEVVDAPVELHRNPLGRAPVATHAGAAFFCEQLKKRLGSVNATRWKILVAGCGAGHEAAFIQATFGCQVEAVDIELFASPELQNTPGLTVGIASVTNLPFEQGQFDAVFYHHVIEHVNDPHESICEISRVLKPGGWLFIGTPNRHRLISAVGAHQQTDWESTWQNKLKENWQDWRARLLGRFRNELGAHAGFSQSELDKMLSKHFERRDWLTGHYLRFKYRDSRARWLLPMVTSFPFVHCIPPGIYVFAQR